MTIDIYLFLYLEFHIAMERVKISNKFAEEEQKILGLVCYVKKQLGFSPVYDENKVIGSENEYQIAFRKNREGEKKNLSSFFYNGYLFIFIFLTEFQAAIRSK